MSEVIKEELLNLLKESEAEDEPGLDEIVTNTKDTNEAIKFISCYKEILKTKNKRIINIV